MANAHISQHTLEVVEEVAAGSLAAVIALISLISIATLVYAWLIP